MNQDEEHLRLLSIFHYVLGALAVFWGCIPIVHLVIGLVFLVGGASSGQQGFPEALFGAFFMLIGGFIMCLEWVHAALLLVAGRSLAQRRRRLFCIVVACVNCLFVPMGTILGVFSLIVLVRPSVKALFETQRAQAAPDAAQSGT